MDDFRRQQLDVMIKGIRLPDEEARSECRRRWDGIAKPIGGLGIFEDLTAQIAAIERTPDVRIDRRVLAVFCADNGIVDEGVAQTDKSVTATVTSSLAKGTASANAMAGIADADVLPIDIGIAGKTDEPGVIDCKVSEGTGDFLKGPAMSQDEALEGILTGIQTASRLKVMGYDIIAAGEMGIGNSTTSAAVAAVMLSLSPEEVTGRGAGLSDDGLRRKTEVIREGIRIHDPDPKEPLDVLASLGGLDIAGICGLMLGGGIYGIPVVMDGIVSCAAALIATALAPGVRGYLIPSHEGREPVCRETMEFLGFRPVIHADLALGEGTGALLLFPLLSMALSVYRQNTTFGDIEIEPYKRYI